LTLLIMQSNDSYIFYRSWWELLGGLDRETRDEVVCAINEYVFEGRIPEDISPLARGVFMGIRMSIDLAKQKYEKVCEKRREAGKKGAATTNKLRWGENRQMSANVDKCQQTSTKSTDNVNDNDNDNDFLSEGIDNKPSPIVEGSSDCEQSDAPSSEKISFENLIKFWNEKFEKHVNVPKLKRIDGQRRKLTKARISEYGKQAFANAIANAAASSFLTDGQFPFTYDWFIKPNNFPKVLDGNYRDTEPENKAGQPRTVSFEEGRARYYDGDRTLFWAGKDVTHQVITTMEEAIRCGLPYQPFHV
ncbi:MAG: hypothetical protein KBS77_07700, partial [Bacteroidales bacterium]|nr:hypothetical protein [Candidatus Colicola faecequi]